LDDLWESLFTACCELEIIKNQYEWKPGLTVVFIRKYCAM
jgi:hypothetical protein